MIDDCHTYSDSDSGDENRERPSRGVLPQSERTYKIDPPPYVSLEVLRWVAVSHYAARVEQGLALRGFDLRRN